MTTIPVRLQVKVTAASLIINDKKQLKAVMRAAGGEVLAVTKRLIGGEGGGRVYDGPGGSAGKYRGGYQKGQYQASAVGESPAKVTGTLLKSLKLRVFKSGEGVAIRSNLFYALFLEAGAKGGGRYGRRGNKVRGGKGIGKTRVLEARPFLTRALDERRTSLEKRIHAAIEQDIKFVRQKA